MNCTVCGAKIPDGQTTCPSCGNPIATSNSSQPVQPMGGFAQPVQPGQPMGGYQQPVQPGQPMGDYQQGQPMGGYQQGQPMGGYQQGQPMGGYQQGQPMGGYQQPMGGYQQPINGYGQPMGGYQQPMGGSAVNFNGFANSLKGQAGSMKLLALIGGVFITLAPFFNWYSAKVKYDGESEKEHFNLFGLDTAFFTITALIMILCGVVLVAEALKDNIPAVQSILNKNQYMQYVGLGLVVLVLLFWFLAFFNGDLKAIIESEKESLDFMKEWIGDDVKGHVNHGFGPILSMIGIVCSAFPRVMQLLKKTNY
ncbi:MAG: zinc-ribbon domain-containing protein [Clostridium sp.]|nr:zinc-ribbon domain-containing protein [Clostridium sp.]MCM1208743.1 zinc-ribbon domain-containing protein [Ruminococcus sp.]